MTECARCGDAIECNAESGKAYGNPDPDCWCTKMPKPSVVNFGGCLCRRCLQEYVNRTWRYHAVERALVCEFEEMGFEVEEDEFDTMWKASHKDMEFNLTELANRIMEALDQSPGD